MVALTHAAQRSVNVLPLILMAFIKTFNNRNVLILPH